jgi:hypothetical protein
MNKINITFSSCWYIFKSKFKLFLFAKLNFQEEATVPLQLFHR